MAALADSDGSYHRLCPGPLVVRSPSLVTESPTSLLYSTFLGGSNGEAGQGIVVDATGGAYIAGYTSSANFPTTPGAFQPSCGGGDAFMSTLDTGPSTPTATPTLYTPTVTPTPTYMPTAMLTATRTPTIRLLYPPLILK